MVQLGEVVRNVAWVGQEHLTGGNGAEEFGSALGNPDGGTGPVGVGQFMRDCLLVFFQPGVNVKKPIWTSSTSSIGDVRYEQTGIGLGKRHLHEALLPPHSHFQYVHRAETCPRA